MINPFTEDKKRDSQDGELVASALKGDKGALGRLVERHQNWIYNIALRMVGNPQDAEDVAQEALLKIITKLSTFQGRSSFRTWAYRVVTNHVLNMKKSSAENKLVSFDQYWESIDGTPDMDMPDQNGIPVDMPLLLEEINIHCMMGMLLCLNRELRLTFILGEVFGVSDKIGSEILEISRDLFRQRLSRARNKLYDFMREKCGLIQDENPCHCDRKMKALLDSGSIDPGNLMFQQNYMYRVKTISGERQHRFRNLLTSKCRRLFREHPFQNSPDFIASLREILESSEFEHIFGPVQ
ncbi:MAG: RNA polymerase sigma factor [Gemmatimonadota bacterium]|nr:MAG: RNA polymerase sigma factor [Gemmatimonadota bacterium]